MELHLQISGVLLMAIALLHARMPGYLKWDKEFSSLSVINRQLMYVHTFFIALLVFLAGLLCLTSPGELLETRLGKRVSLGLGLFWALRLLFQFFVFSRKTWKGKPFETTVHVLISLFWIYLCIVFILAYYA